MTEQPQLPLDGEEQIPADRVSYCPRCGKRALERVGWVYVDDEDVEPGDEYSLDTADKYQCKFCLHTFVDWDCNKEEAE